MSHLRNMRIMDGTSTDLAQVSTTGDIHIVLRNFGSSVSSNNGTQLNITNFNTTGGQIFNNSTNAGFVQISDGSSRVVPVVENSVGTKAFNIHDADFHIKLINRYFLNFTGDIRSLGSSADSGNTQVVLTSTSGLSTANWIFISTNGIQETDAIQIRANSTVTMTLTLDRPLDNDYTTGLGQIEVVSPDLNTSGGTLASPLSFKLLPSSGATWHITRFLVTMQDGTVMDTAKFGGGNPLTNGVVIRENKTQTRICTNWKTNTDIMNDTFDFNFHDKAPSGSFGMAARWTLKKNDVISRLDGSLGENDEILLQDNMNFLEGFRIKAQGHVEEG